MDRELLSQQKAREVISTPVPVFGSNFWVSNYTFVVQNVPDSNLYINYIKQYQYQSADF